jgi:hypothetical protein
MKCQQCKKLEALGIPRNVCKSCLGKLVARSVKRSLKINSIIRKKEKVAFVDDGRAESKFLKQLLLKIINKYPMRIVFVKANTAKGLASLAKNYDKIIVSYCLEDSLNEFLTWLFLGKSKAEGGRLLKSEARGSTVIIPLRKFTQQEISILTGKKQRPKLSGNPLKFLEGIEEKYPGSKFALLKSAEKFTEK